MMLRKNKTIGSRIASVGFALSLLLSTLDNMGNLFVRAGETAETQATTEAVTETITDLMNTTEETAELPELLNLPAVFSEENQENSVLPSQELPKEEASELNQVTLPTASTKSMAVNTDSVTITSESSYPEGTPEYYYQQYAEDNFLSAFTLQYLDIDQSKGETFYHVEKEEDFTLQYQMYFHMGILPVQKGNLKIKVPAKLFDFRDGTPALPNDGLSAKQIIFNENGEMCETDGTPATSSGDDKLVIRYYEETDENGNLYYVYTNIDNLKSSFGRTFSTVYPKMDVYDITDGTTWDIHTELSVTYDFNKFYVNPATGVINTAATLVTGPDNTVLYRIVADSASGKEFNYYTFEQLDENGMNSSTILPEYYSKTDGKFYHVSDNTEYIPQEGEFQPQIFTIKLDATVPELTGRVDTNAEFDSVTKTKLENKSYGSSNYGPWFYNNEQVKDFLKKSIDDKYFTTHDVTGVTVTNRENKTTDIKENDYLLMGYQITASNLHGNQPWLFVLDETTLTTLEDVGEIGEVVGIRFRNLNNTGAGYCRKATADDFEGLTEEQYNSSYSSVSYSDFLNHVQAGKVWIGADSSEENRSSYSMATDVEDNRNYSFQYDVVVAYPTVDETKNELAYVEQLRNVTENSDTFDVTYGDIEDPVLRGFENSVTAYLFPADINTDTETPATAKADSADAIAGYKAFQFKYGNGSYPEFNKYSERNYQGWLSSYDLGNAVPELKFHVNSSVDSAGKTHDGAELNGKTVEMNVVDDRIIGQAIAYSDGKTLKSIPVQLDAGDYYYTSVTLDVRERDLNKADGSYIIPATAPTAGKDLDWHLYYMEKNDTAWKEFKIADKPVYTMAEYMHSPPESVSKYKSITIKFEDYDIKPYRVRMVHETELGISNMNMTLRMTPETEDGSAFKLNKALRTLYEENPDKTLNTSGTAYGNYGAEIDGYTLAIDNYAGYRLRLKNADGTYTLEDLIYINNNQNDNNPNHYKYDWRQNHSEYRGYQNSSFAVPYQKTDDNGLAEAFPDGEDGEIKLYETDFGENTTHQNTRLIRGRAEVTTLDKNAGAEKYAQAVNDVDKSRVNITYTLSGYEGYLVDPLFSDQIIQNVSNLEIAANQGIDNTGNAITIASPQREYIYFYDLLPPGVEYDAAVAPVVARTKVPTVYDANQQNGYDPDVFVNSYWDTSAAEIVSLSDDQTAIKASITTNWNGTSRTLVKFKVKVSNEDTSYTYDPTSKEWFFGCGIRFGTYVKWENYGLARLSDNLFCYVGSTESDNGEIYSEDLIGRRGTQIYMDDPNSTISGAFLKGTEAKYYSCFKKGTDIEKDFDNDSNILEYNRAYARKNNLPVMPNASQGHISKAVRADENKTAEFVTETAVTTGGDYTYRISLDSFAPNALGDIVIYDELEETVLDADNSGKTEYWQGKFNSVDVSALRNYLLLLNVSQSDIDANLKIYYTHDENPEIPVKQETVIDEQTGNQTVSYTGEIDLHSGNTPWIEATDGKIDVNDTNTNRVTAVAVVYHGELRTNTHQAVTQLKTSIDIKMTAPLDAANSKYPYAKNKAWYSVSTYETDENSQYQRIPVSYGDSSSTIVTIGEKMKLIITKTLGDSVPDELQDEVFNFHINAYVGKVTVDGTDIEVKEQPFANIPYELYQKKYISASEYDALSPEAKENYILEETEYYCWESIENTIPHTTDANGSLHLKDKQKAEFTYISLVDYASFHITTEELAKREIDAYNIEEEVKPYWYATKEVKTQTGQTSPEGFSYSECSVEFRNDFRPVIYLNKTVGYIPESMKNADQTFDFIFRIKDNEGNYLTVNDLKTGGTCEIKNKEFLSNINMEGETFVSNGEMDNPYENGVFYLYNTASSAGKYSSPKRWYPWLTEKGLYYYSENDAEYIEKSKLIPYTFSQIASDNDLKKYVKHLTHDELGTTPADTAYFVMSVKGGETVGIPVYLGNGMLDENKQPKYSFEIFESSAEYYKEILNDNIITKNVWGDVTSDWILTNITNVNAVYSPDSTTENKASGVLSEEIALKYENIGRFKEINLTKNVEFPDEELLKETAFRFRITRNISDSTPISEDSGKLWSDDKAIHWRLVDDNGNTVINKVMKTVDGKEVVDYIYTYEGDVTKFTETIDNKTIEYGEFVVPLLGMEGYHVVLDHIEAGYPYTVTEILDTPATAKVLKENDFNSDTGKITLSFNKISEEAETVSEEFILATDDAYTATTKTDTKQIPEKIVAMPMTIVNVYKKRNLKIQKTVAAPLPLPPANTEYTFTVKRQDGETFTVGDYEVTDISGKEITPKPAITNIGNLGKEYQFKLKSDQIITFYHIGNMNDAFIVTESGTLPDGISRLVGADGRTPVILPETVSSATEEVVNGDPNFVIIRKSYSGNGYTESVRDDILTKSLNMQLSFYKVSDNTELPITENTIKNNVYLKNSSGMQFINNLSSVTYETNKAVIPMTGNDSIIVNLAAIASEAGLNKNEIGYRIIEIIPEDSKKLIPENEDAFYFIESDGTGSGKNIFSANGSSASLLITNTVTKYSSVIYKRIMTETDTPPVVSGQIAFNITDTETGEAPESMIYYVPAYEDEEGNTIAVLDARGSVGNGNGSFTIDADVVSGHAWRRKNESQGENKKTDTIAYYVLKLYLSDNVAVNASSNYSIDENLAETDSSWGSLIGHEATALSKIRTLSEDGDGNITEEWLEDGLQWAYHDMDTFVNTNITSKITMHKTVEMDTLTEDAETTDFTYTLYEKHSDTEWSVLPNISYTIYEGDKVVSTGATDENGQLQLQHNQTIEFDVPKFTTLRLVEDNTGKYRLKTDDDGNLTEDALIIGDDTLTNVHEISNGFSMDAETEVPDGMPVGNDVAITRLFYKPHNYFYMGIRFVELVDTADRTKEENYIYNSTDFVNHLVGYQNNIKGAKNQQQLVTPISVYTPSGNTNINLLDDFTADKNVEYVYAYDKSGENCCGDVIWSMWAGTAGLAVIDNTSSSADKQITRALKGNTGEPNNLGYVNLNYCFDDTKTSSTAELTIPEYIVVARFDKIDENGNRTYTYTKQKVVGITANTLKDYNDSQAAISATAYTLNLPKTVKTIGYRALWRNFNVTTINIAGVHEIKTQAFSSRSNKLKTVNITADGKDSVIEADAFKDCTGLTSVTINNIATVNDSKLTPAFDETITHYNDSATAPTPEPLFQFRNTTYKGVTVKLNTYDYDTYYGTLTDEAKRLEAHTLETQYHTRYQLNELNVDEFTAVLKGGTDVNALRPIAGTDFKRYNSAGMYYSVTSEEKTYIIRPTGTADFQVYYRNEDGNIVYVFNSQATAEELEKFAEKDGFVTSKFTDDVKTAFLSASYEKRLELLFGKNAVTGELNAVHVFRTDNSGLFHLFDGDWADFEHIHNDDNYAYLKAYTIWEKDDIDTFDTVQEINTDRLIPCQDEPYNEHTRQAKYSAVYKNTDYLSSQEDFSIYKEGLTTLYLNEYVGLSEDELQITKKIPYWNTLSDPTGDSFVFHVLIGDEDISGSEDYTYYITPQKGKTDTEAKKTAVSVKNAEFILKSGETLHIIGLLNGQSVKIKEDSAEGYGVVTDEKLKYNILDGYYTELQYDSKSDYQRTFRNYPLSISLTKQVTNPEGNEEVIQNSVFTFQLCKQETTAGTTVYTPLTEAEMKKMRGYLLASSAATKFEELIFFGSDGNEFNLKAGQTAVIVGTEPNTIYATKEISCTIDGVRSENSYQKKNNGITVLTSDSLQNTASQTYLTGTSTGTQENTYFPQNGLTISKLIENDYNHLTNPNAEYLFKIEKINGNNSHESLNNQQYKLNGVTQKTTTEQGYFTLKENEYAFFNLNPAEYKITEINPNKSYTQLNNIYNNYYSENNQTNTLTNQILFTTTYIVDGGESRELYAQNTSSENDNSAIVKFTGKEEQSISFTNHVIDKEYQFNIEKIIYRDKNAHGDTNDNEQRFVFRIDRYAIDADVNNLPKQSIETFYVTLNCPNPVEYEQNEKKYYLNHSEFELPLFGLDENTSFDSENQKITKTYTDSNEQYTYPASIWQGSVSTVVNRKGVYKVTEVTGWSATDYDYCKGSNTFKCAETVVHSDKSVNNTDYVAFKLEENSEKTASFSNAESEFAYFSSSAYAINRIQAVQN